MLNLAGGEWESCERPSPASQERPLWSLADDLVRTLLIAVPGDDPRSESALALDIAGLLGLLTKENGRGRIGLVSTY